jgi:hypothetical protein
MNFKIVSYYTEDTPYEQIAHKHLIPSLQKLNLDYEIDVVKNYGTWYKNTAHKGQFILNKLEKYKRIVWVDVDAEVLKYPKLFDEISDEYDIAIHYLSWNRWYGYNNNKDVNELLTGTMYFKDSHLMRVVCKKWHEIASKTNIWEQKVLQKVIKSYNLKIYELPLEYIYMNSRPRGEPPLIKLDPVILHHQASREWKRKIHILSMLKKRDETRNQSEEII